MKPPASQLSRECRFLAAKMEIRAAAESGEPAKVFGYAAKFNSDSVELMHDGTEFREVIKPGAFDEVLGNDVRALFNHDNNQILARSKAGAGTLQIGVDEVGLWYEFEAPDTQAGRDLVTSIKRGDIDQSSFSFRVADGGDSFERVTESPDRYVRTITKVGELYDVSPVTNPAYPDASVALRSLDKFKELQTRSTDDGEGAEGGDGAQGPTDQEISEVADWAARLGL